MTIDEAIARLQELRNVVGGNANLCVQTGAYEYVSVFKSAKFELIGAVLASNHTTHRGVRVPRHWVSLIEGNNTKIVRVF